ncbi:FAD-dependent oxidoreductase [Actinomadura macra]|uniref:FAD-dependent oxidoreductase n=1 Tax=Actinomadura macra TaxID=46164 RepID=UPI000831C8A1|nr:FAD-dependent oxidoreductase [Actinomadura macra]
MGAAEATADVAVVGTGIVGLATAWAVAEQGSHVVLIGPRSHEGQASTAAGAMLAPFSETSAGEDQASDPAEIAHRAAARARYGEWVARLRSASDRQVTMTEGLWLVATSYGGGDLETLEAVAQAARAHGSVAEAHPPAQVPGLLPARTCPAHAALWLPGEGCVDTGELMGALTHLLAGHRLVRWADTQATGLAPAAAHDPAGALAVRCAGGEYYETGRVVLAAGSGTGAVCAGSPELELALPPVLAGKGVSLLLREVRFALPLPVRTPLRNFACGSHLVPRADGAAYLGATNRLTPPGEVAVHPALEEINAVICGVGDELNTGVYHHELAGIRVGHRPYTLDHLPLVGPTGDPRVVAATATYRNGVLLAPYVADLVAGHLDGDRPLDRHPWRPTRPISVPPLGHALPDQIQTLIDVLLPANGVTPAWHQDLQALLGVAARQLLTSAPTDDRWRSLHRLWERAPVAETLPVMLRAVRDLPEDLPGPSIAPPSPRKDPSMPTTPSDTARGRWQRSDLTPFGVVLLADDTADLADLPSQWLKELLLREHLILLRRFTGAETIDQLEEFACRLGEPVLWGDRPAMSVRAQSNPDDHVNETGFLPIHWDGMYKPDTPDFQVFQCLRSVDAAVTGGATLFSDTTKVMADADPGTRSLWRSLTFRYDRPLGEEIISRTCPLVVEHPHTGQPTLRFTEPVPEGTTIINPPRITLERVPAGHDTTEIMRRLQEVLYDPRHMYAHHWQDGDIVLTDNRSLLHTREPYPPGAERHLLRVHITLNEADTHDLAPTRIPIGDRGSTP